MRYLLWLTVPAVLLGALAFFYAGDAVSDEAIGDEAIDHEAVNEEVARGGRGAHPRHPASRPWARFQERFDLDGDGRITWEEYQKGQSGFARLDTDGDGNITVEDASSWPAEGRPPRGHLAPPPPRNERGPGPSPQGRPEGAGDRPPPPHGPPQGAGHRPPPPPRGN